MARAKAAAAAPDAPAKADAKVTKAAAAPDAPAAPAARSKHPQYDAAMAQRHAGTLGRRVMTELGWVTPAPKA